MKRAPKKDDKASRNPSLTGIEARQYGHCRPSRKDIARGPWDAFADVDGFVDEVRVGSPTGIRINVRQGQPLPANPHGHSWMLVGDDEDKC